MTDSQPYRMRIDIVSDVVCPWCIIGYRQLSRALEGLEGVVEAETHWHPFELNPDMPPEGEDMGEHVRRKYRITAEQSAANRARIADAGRAAGFDFAEAPGGQRMRNTFRAHKLLALAGSVGGWRQQTTLKLAMFEAHFREGRNVDDDGVLVELAEAAGLDGMMAAAALADPDLGQRVKAEEAYWIDRGTSGVPATIIGGAYMVPGAQDAEMFARVIRKVAERQAAAA